MKMEFSYDCEGIIGDDSIACLDGSEDCGNFVEISGNTITVNGQDANDEFELDTKPPFVYILAQRRLCPQCYVDYYEPH
jgi:hypothetical protein